MIARIKKYKRYGDYYAIKCFEVKIAILVTVILSYLFVVKLDCYNYFFVYQNDIKQVLLTLVGGEFTLLGMSLAGMAIITAMFSPEVLKIINSIDKNDTINRVLSQFEFSALNLGIQIVYLIVIYLSVASNAKVIIFPAFIICFLITSYHFTFNVFYIVSLIGNCIRINEIKNICTNISMIDKNYVSIANEVRIDYILALILKERGINRESMLKDLFNIIDQSNILNKQEIKEYLSHYYHK